MSGKIVVLLFFIGLASLLRAQAYRNASLKNDIILEWTRVSLSEGHILDSNCLSILESIQDSPKQGEAVIDSFVKLYDFLRLSHCIDLFSIEFSISHGEENEIQYKAMYFLEDHAVFIYYDLFNKTWSKQVIIKQEAALINRRELIELDKKGSCYRCGCSNAPTILTLVNNGRVSSTTMTL